MPTPTPRFTDVEVSVRGVYPTRIPAAITGGDVVIVTQTPINCPPDCGSFRIVLRNNGQKHHYPQLKIKYYWPDGSLLVTDLQQGTALIDPGTSREYEFRPSDLGTGYGTAYVYFIPCEKGPDACSTP
jgi:hypothetical protein